MVPVAMVLQSDSNDIRIFSAVPEAFKNIEFYNLPAVGNVCVPGAMSGGKVQEIKYEKDGKEISADALKKDFRIRQVLPLR
ncbi:MAG: hypothetical protein LBS52_04165 [Dysgonamonadaceae bacterium]|jgi:hypothetical protein|nr:hypothetical protein [Dysgonamonadaceae bacterium]